MNADALTKLPVTPYRISNGALGAGDLPRRLKLARWGRNESAKGPLIVDDASLDAFERNQRALGFDRVAIDYEHNTVPGTEAFAATSEPRTVAGYGTPRIVRGDGLWLEDIEWTPSGQAAARNYADLSPAPRQDKDGRVLFLHSAALCRNGAIYDLSFFSVESEDGRQFGYPPDYKAIGAHEPLTWGQLGALFGTPLASPAEIARTLKAVARRACVTCLHADASLALLGVVSHVRGTEPRGLDRANLELRRRGVRGLVNPFSAVHDDPILLRELLELLGVDSGGDDSAVMAALNHQMTPDKSVLRVDHVARFVGLPIGSARSVVEARLKELADTVGAYSSDGNRAHFVRLAAATLQKILK